MTDRTPTSDRACARYWGSDGTLCATHNGRFATQADMRCDRTPTSDPVAALDAAWEALIADAVGSFNPSSVIRRHRPIIAAEARQQARAAFAAQVVAGAIAIHVNDGSSHDRAMAWSEGYSEGFAAASPEPANNALFIGADGAITDPNDDGRVVPAVTLDYESVWYHQGWERGYATAKAEVASPEPASPGSGLSEAFFDNVRIPDSNPVAQTPYGRGFNAAAQIIRDRLAARPDGAEADAFVNAEAGDYIEDDPEAWVQFVDALRRYAPEIPPLVAQFGDGGYEIIAGTLLSYLADEHGLYVVRDPKP